MSILVWIAQIALAFLYLSGGAYKTFSFEEVANQLTTLSLGGWRAVGVFEIVGGVLLAAPALVKRLSPLTPLVCAALALETFALAALYASYSLELAVSNPLVWSVVMGLLVVFVGYQRSARGPRDGWNRTA